MRLRNENGNKFAMGLRNEREQICEMALYLETRINLPNKIWGY